MIRSFRYITILVAFVFLWSCDNSTDSLTDSSSETQLQQDFSAEDAASFGKHGVKEFEITITNLTPATGPGASQPLSPPVLAAHHRHFHVFHKGRHASPELVELAEDAVSGPLVDALNSSDRVYSVAQGGGVILPGASTTIMLTTTKRFRKLSIVSMLVNTNDAFAGLDGINLPAHGSRTVYMRAYDAGSEANTESFDHIPGPCCGNPFVRVPTNERIRFHRGISGNGDLDPDVYGWHGPVAKVTITRVN